MPNHSLCLCGDPATVYGFCRECYILRNSPGGMRITRDPNCSACEIPRQFGLVIYCGCMVRGAKQGKAFVQAVIASSKELKGLLGRPVSKT